MKNIVLKYKNIVILIIFIAIFLIPFNSFNIKYLEIIPLTIILSINPITLVIFILYYKIDNKIINKILLLIFIGNLITGIMIKSGCFTSRLFEIF